MKALGKTPLPACILHGLGYLTLALVLAGWAAALTLRATDGELVPPLDDTYIYLQYARSAAAGEPLAYQPGAEPTRGATSLLYPLLLAPWARVLPPERLMWAAWALGTLCLAGSALAADRWAARVLGRSEAGWAAGLLTLLSGHFLWGTVSGMDIGITALATAGALASVPWYLDAPDPRSGVRRLAALGGWLLFLGLARPEGLLLAGVIAAGVPLAGRAPNSRRARWILVLFPAAAGAVTFGVNLMALGSPDGNTLIVKSVWTEPRPDVRAAMIGRLPWVVGRVAFVLFSDFGSRALGAGTGYLLRGLLMAGATWGAVAALLRGRGGAAARILVAVLLGVLAAALVPAGYDTHHWRYQIPYVPVATLLVVLGWFSAFPARVRLRWRLLPLAVAGGLLLPELVHYEHYTARNAENIHDQQVACGRWIHDHLPPDAIVGINDAGAIAYFGGRRILDLVGLVTNGPARAYRAGPGSLYEWLEVLPHDRRPTYFAIFPDWFPYLRRTSLVGKRLARFSLVDNTISGGDMKAVYQADWSHVGGADDLWIRRDLVDVWGFQVIDVLDVADLASQRAHRYVAFDKWRDTLREFPVADIPRFLIIDGGRQPSRGERFTLHARPGEPGALIMRTEAFRDFQLEVRVDGQDLGVWKIPRASLTWTEPLFEIPPGVIRGDRARIELTLTGSDQPYPSYHYWLLQ